MADSKVTDLTAATSVNSADVLYTVQSNTDKKLSISTLLANLPDTLLNVGGLLALDVSSPQTLANSGAISITETVTLLTSEAGSYAITIADGSYAGQIKIILCSSGTGTQTITNNIRATSIAFSETGHSAVLMFYNGLWWPLGGTATITY